MGRIRGRWNREKDVPAKQPPPQEEAWLSGPDAHQDWPRADRPQAP